MKRTLALILAVVLLLALLCSCGTKAPETQQPAEEPAAAPAAETKPAEESKPAEETKPAETPAAEEKGTHIVVDATGAEVEVPNAPQCIAIPQMVLPNMVYALQGTAENIYAIPPAAYSGWEISALRYLAPELETVNTTICGDDSSLNIEECIAAGVDLVLVFDSSSELQDQLKAVGIPCVLLHSASNMDDLKSLLLLMGDALGCQERAAEVLQWYEETESYFDSKQDAISAIPEDQLPRVLCIQKVEPRKVYTKGMSNYITKLEGGTTVTMDSMLTEMSMEEIIAYNPEIIFLSNFDKITPQQLYDNAIEGQDWSGVDAVKNGRVYKIPCGLYRWAPPNTFEKPFYMLWTAQFVQPEIFNDYDLRQVITDFYHDFYGYDLSEDQLNEILRTEMNNY